MSFDWQEYLNFAGELAGVAGCVSCEEAGQRSAISRAYYAAFCIAKNYLEERGRGRFASADVYRQVQMAFLSATGNKDSIRIGNQLQRMHISRKKAFYDSIFNGIDPELRSVLKQARKVIEALR